MVHRIDAVTDDGTAVSLVAKREEPEAIKSATAVRAHNPGVLDGIVPQVYASQVDDDIGMLLMEHIGSASQGDVLVGCTEEQAESLIRGISRLHARSVGLDRSTAPTSWTVNDIDQETWRTKLATAATNHPEILDEPMVERLDELPTAVQAAVGALGEDEWCWIHADLHLDNLLFRPDDSAVILDWASARIGPPAIDLGHILTEGLDREAPAERIERWGPVYTEEAARFGAIVDLGRLRESIGWSILPLLRGVIGWASRDDLFADRLIRVRENLLRNTTAWLDTGIIPVEI